MSHQTNIFHVNVSDIEWPEDADISCSARELISILLQKDPALRPTANAIKEHMFFNQVDFDNLAHQEMPFVPRPSSGTDTSYFEGTNHALFKTKHDRQSHHKKKTQPHHNSSHTLQRGIRHKN